MKAFRLDREDIMSQVTLMPPTKHDYRSDRTAPFDYCQSDVAAWIANIPAVRRQLFEFANQNKLIKFDKEKSLWVGHDWTPDSQVPPANV